MKFEKNTITVNGDTIILIIREIFLRNIMVVSSIKYRMESVMQMKANSEANGGLVC